MAMNKPYAYAIVQGEDGMENISLQFDHPEMCGQKYRQAIPLFTHPVKELTDEEISEIVKDCIEDDYNMISNPYSVAYAVQEAILRKAQEK